MAAQCRRQAGGRGPLVVLGLGGVCTGQDWGNGLCRTGGPDVQRCGDRQHDENCQERCSSLARRARCRRPRRRWYEIVKGSDSKPAAKKALKRGAKTIVVCGGDGSVRAASEAIVGTETALAVVPSGTANLFASGLELPTDIDEIVEIIARGDRRSIDTAVCNGMTFNVMAGSGFDVAMLSDAEEGKERLGTFAYVGAAVRETRKRKMFDTKISIDGDVFYEGPPVAFWLAIPAR